MKRYFYTHAHRALAMHLDHGLTFETPKGVRVTVPMMCEIIASGDQCKLYVREESKHLLNRQMHDFLIFSVEEQRMMAPEIVPPADSTVPPGHKIVLRAEVPFFWPDGVEEASTWTEGTTITTKEGL